MSDYPYEAIVVLGDKDEIVEYTGDELVRCKDCKYMLQYEQIKACCNVNSFLQEPKCVSDNDFCSRGERADE